MIKMKALTGRHAGKVREVASGISAQQILYEFCVLGWEWEIDYSAATEEEKYQWFRHDLSSRIVRALRAGRSVRFLKKIYRVADVSDTDELMFVAGKIEDTIVASGFNVSLERDDETGVVVRTHGRTQ
jgi:hypothetical protein